MRIGISAIHVRPGMSGSHQPYLVNLVAALSKVETRHGFTLFVTPSNRALFAAAEGVMDFVVYPRSAEKVLPRILYEQLRLPRDAKHLALDVLHYAGTAASLFVRRSDVVTIHHDSVTQRRSMGALHNLYYDAVLRFCRRAGGVIAPTQVYAEQLVDFFGYAPERAYAVHHGVSPLFREAGEAEAAAARAQYGIEPGAIVTVTNTRPHKNIPNLLRAFAVLGETHGLDRQLVMVGRIDETILRAIAAEISARPEALLSRVRVIPFLPHEALPAIYAAAEVFVFFSQVETFGMPLVEAMACELPLVASDIPIHREVMGGAGCLVSPDDPAALAAALFRTLTDAAYREALVASSRERAGRFSWEQTARDTIAVYEAVQQGAGR